MSRCTQSLDRLERIIFGQTGILGRFTIANSCPGTPEFVQFRNLLPIGEMAFHDFSPFSIEPTSLKELNA